MTARCDLTDLLPDECAHCRGITDLPKLPPKWSGPHTWIEAAYPGHCSGCDEAIHPGDLIISDHDGGWLGQCCGEEPERPVEDVPTWGLL